MTDGQAVKVFLKDTLAALGSSRDGAESFFDHEECQANKAKLEPSLKAYDCNVSDAQQGLPELKLKRDTVDKLTNIMGEAEKPLGAS